MNLLYKQTHGSDGFMLTVTDNLKADEEPGIGSQKATNWMKDRPASVSRSAGSVRPPQFSSPDNLCLSFFLSSFLSFVCVFLSFSSLFLCFDTVTLHPTISGFGQLHIPSCLGIFLTMLNPSLAFVYRNWQHLSFVLIPFYYYSPNISSLSGQHFFFFSSSCLWCSWMSSVSVWKPKQINKNRKIFFFATNNKDYGEKKNEILYILAIRSSSDFIDPSLPFFLQCAMSCYKYYLLFNQTKHEAGSVFFSLSALLCVTLDVVASWQCLIILNERRVYFLK